MIPITLLDKIIAHMKANGIENVVILPGKGVDFITAHGPAPCIIEIYGGQYIYKVRHDDLYRRQPSKATVTETRNLE